MNISPLFAYLRGCEPPSTSARLYPPTIRGGGYSGTRAGRMDMVYSLRKLDLYASRKPAAIAVLSQSTGGQVEAEATKLVWHRHRGPRRARFSRGGVAALLPVLASSRTTLGHRQECMCHTNQNDKGTCSINSPK